MPEPEQNTRSYRSPLDQLQETLHHRGEAALNGFPPKLAKRIVDLIESKQLDNAMILASSDYNPSEDARRKGQQEAYESLRHELLAAIQTAENASTAEGEKA